MVFKTKREMKDYILSGKKLRCNYLTYVFVEGSFYFFSSTSSKLKLSRCTMEEFIDTWFHKTNIEKIKENKPYKTNINLC